MAQLGIKRSPCLPHALFCHKEETMAHALANQVLKGKPAPAEKKVRGRCPGSKVKSKKFHRAELSS